MKRILFITLCVFALACTKTPEQKAEALIKEALLKSLALPDTYQAVETTLDSAYIPYTDPAVIDAVLSIRKKEVELAALGEDIESYTSAHSKEYDALTEEIQESLGALEEIIKEPEFIGYYVHHRYREKDNAGNTILRGKYFLFDKDISQIIAQWEEEEIDAYDEFWVQAVGAALEAESSN